MRPRNALIAACPWLSRDSASKVLRSAGGDVERAKRAALVDRRRGQQKQSTSPSSNANQQSCNRTEQEDSNNIIPVAAEVSRAPPRHSVSINNLSDRQYCCVWAVEVYEDGYRPDVARTLLANIARHVNPILRDRGWRVKRLIESASAHWVGLCTANGRRDADASSTNIQLNVRVQPSKHCRQFRSFHQILAVMLHEITHTSIGLEDIHPPAFYELLDEIKREYRKKLGAGEVDLENDEYGCKGQFISSSGQLASVSTSASDILGRGGHLGVLDTITCGAKKGRKRGPWKKSKNKYTSTSTTSNVQKDSKKRPLLKGAKMVDKRTKAGKASMVDRDNLSAGELAARAALARFGNAHAHAPSSASTSTSTRKRMNMNMNTNTNTNTSSDVESEDEVVETSKNGKKEDAPSSNEEEGEDYLDEWIQAHKSECSCRSCDWSTMFNLS